MKCGTLWMLTLELNSFQVFPKTPIKTNINSIFKMVRLKIYFTMKAFFIQTGTVHAIGSGILLAEIQQTSDITYRIFDWNRTDKYGNTRELHTKQALDAIDFAKWNDRKVAYATESNQRNPMVHTPYFTTEIIVLEGEIYVQTDQLDSFVVLMAVKGDNQISVDGNNYNLPFGSTVLLPACLTGFTIQANQSEVLMVTILGTPAQFSSSDRYSVNNIP